MIAKIYLVETVELSREAARVFTTLRSARRHCQLLATSGKPARAVEYQFIGTPKTVAQSALVFGAAVVGGTVLAATDSITLCDTQTRIVAEEVVIHESSCIASKTNSSSEEATT